MVICPVIVRTKPGLLMDVFKDYRDYIFWEPPKILTEISPLAEPSRLIPRFNMFSGLFHREVIWDLAVDERVERIYEDRIVWAWAYPTVPPEGVFEVAVPKRKTFTTTLWTKALVGAFAANQKGYTGKGILASIVDTGVARFHEQVRRAEFETVIRAQHRDENGHGTWCVACVGGVSGMDEYLTRLTGKIVWCEGMAPACDLLAVKALGFYVGTGSTSGIIKGIEISLERGAKVISMSLGSSNPPEEHPEDDAFYPVFEECKAQNTIPVVAAGNDGPEGGTIGSPGNMPNCLSVGAYDPITGVVANFSSRGPTKWGDIKPDVIMPGVNIDSACCGVIDWGVDKVPNRYAPISGTSMATPHAAGMVVLIEDAYRRHLGKTVTLDEIQKMMYEFRDHDKNNDAGWGVLSWDKVELWFETEYGVKL
jgi:subtilisin family serine protease